MKITTEHELCHYLAIHGMHWNQISSPDWYNEGDSRRVRLCSDWLPTRQHDQALLVWKRLSPKDQERVVLQFSLRRLHVLQEGFTGGFRNALQTTPYELSYLMALVLEGEVMLDYDTPPTQS